MEKSQTGTVIGGRLNLREKPSTQSKRLIFIPDGAQIAVSEYDAQWYKAQYKALDGYVMKQFVQLLPTLPRTWSYGKVKANPLNVRRRPSTSAARWNGPWPKGRIALIKPCVECVSRRRSVRSHPYHAARHEYYAEWPEFRLLV